jgi:hypothetical protein
MTKKYETLKAIRKWCESHPNRKFFYYYEIGIQTRSIGALCEVPFKGRVWVKKVGISNNRDATHGLVQYALSTNV